MLCGCTSTFTMSTGTSNRWCASSTSRPLFMSVAESIVILAPMAHVGCLSAMAALTWESSSRPMP